MSKKFVIVFFIIVIVIASFVTIKLPPKEDKTIKNEFSLEEAKEKLLLTKKIKVKTIPLESDDPIPCPTIQDEESIQKIVTILSEAYIPPKDWWYTLARSVNYHLELVNEMDEIFATIKTNSSSPLELKGEGFIYYIYSDEYQQLTDILKKVCENVKNE